MSIYQAFRDHERTLAAKSKGSHRFPWERDEEPGGLFAKDAEPLEHRRAVVAQVYETLRRECPDAFPPPEPAPSQRLAAVEALGAKYRANPAQASPALLAALKSREAARPMTPDPEENR